MVKRGEYSNTKRSNRINSAAVKRVGRYILKSNSGKKAGVVVTSKSIKEELK